MNHFPRQTNEEYHADTSAISSSGLKLIDRAPRHYWARYLSGKGENKDTPAKVTGTALHCFLLEPDAFYDRYILLPEGAPKRPTKAQLNAKNPSADSLAAMDWWESFTAASDGKLIITSEMLDSFKEIAAEVWRHPITKSLLSIGISEHSIYAVDDFFGVMAKIRCDYAIEPCKDYPNGLIIDVKSAENAEAEAFTKAAFNYDYYLPAVMYPRIFQIAYKTKKPPAFLFLVIEKEFPYLNVYYTPSPSMVEYGMQEYTRLMNVYRRCLASGDWYGYPTEISPLFLPDWVEKKQELRM